MKSNTGDASSSLPPLHEQCDALEAFGFHHDYYDHLGVWESGRRREEVRRVPGERRERGGRRGLLAAMFTVTVTAIDVNAREFQVNLEHPKMVP